MFRFGHFSDIHFQFTNYDTETLREKLVDKLSEFAPLDALFITGDIFNRGDTSPEQERLVTELIQQMANASGCNMSNVYICAGNHDLKRSQARADCLNSIIQHYKDNNCNDLSTDAYTPIIYDGVVIPFNSICERITNNSSSEKIHRFVPLDEINLVILNTSVFAGQTYPGQVNPNKKLEDTNLFICDNKFKILKDEVKQEINKTKLTICLGHHSPDCFEEREKERLIDFLNYFECDFYFCGHIHTSSTKVIEHTDDILQITCGGPFKDNDNYNKPSFVIGEYDPDTSNIKANLYYYINSWEVYTQAYRPWHSGSLDRTIERLKKQSPNGEQVERPQVIDYYSAVKMNLETLDDADTTTIGISRDKIKVSSLCGINIPDNNGSPIIPRHIVPCDHSMDGTSSLPFDCLKEEKHIVLLAGAGQGKTYTLYQIYREAYAQGYHPFFFQLQTIIENNVLSLVAQDKVDIDEQIAFILDGFDELPDNKKSDLVHILENIKTLYPNILIIVSSRENSYSDQLNEFKRYTIKSLTKDDVETFLQQSGIDVALLEEQFGKEGFQHLTENVFSLSSLIEIWKQNKSLPDQSQIVKELIDTRIKQRTDITYCQYEKQENRLPEIKKAFEKIALVMQCMQRYYLTIEEIHNILSNDMNDIMLCRSLWNHTTEKRWCFAHNNCREYLAAKALSRMTLDQVLMFISNVPTSNTIKPSWVNTLSYLINIFPTNDLQNWIYNNQPELVTLFEKDRFTVEQRTEILKTIITKHKEQNSWIDPGHSFLPKLIDFCSAPDSVHFLLNEFHQDPVTRQKQNLLRCLTYFQTYETYDDAVKELVSSIALDKTADLYVRCDAFRLMAYHPDLFNDYTDSSANCANAEKNENLLYYILLFIQKTGKAEEYIDIYIDAYNQYDYYKSHLISLKMISYSTLKNIHDRNTACKLLTLFPQWYRSSHKSNEDVIDLFEKCCDLGIQYYDGEEDPFLIELLSLPFSKITNNRCFEILKNYINKTHTEKIFVNHIILHQTPATHRGYILSQLISDPIIDEIKNLLVSHLIDIPTVENIIRRLPYNTPHQNILIDAVYHETGNRLIVEQPIDYEKESQKGHQQFFDSLFKEKLFVYLVNELITVLGKEAIISDDSYHRLLDNSVQKTNEALFDCYQALNEALPDGEIISIENFEKYVTDRDYFCLNNAAYCLQNHSIEVSSNQKKKLSNLCTQYLEKSDFSDQIKIEEGRLSFSSYLHASTRIFNFLSVQCSEELAIKLLMLPPLLFDTTYDELPECVIRQIQPEALRQCILDIIHKNEWNQFTAPGLINYCKEKRIIECKCEIIEYILDNRINGGYTYPALQCIKELFGIESILDEVLPKCENLELLYEISAIIPNETPSLLLDQKLWVAYKTTTDFRWLEALIKRNNIDALQEYSLRAKECMSLPDMIDEPRVPELTEAIRSITSTSCVSILVDLYLLAYTPNFIDREVFGLKSSCQSAIKTIARKDYKIAKAAIQTIAESNGAEVQTILHDLLDLIDEEIKHVKDEPIDFEAAKELVISQLIN